MRTEDVGYFRAAKNAAEKSPHPEFKIGAVICNKKPIAFGWNQWEKSHPKVEPWAEGRRQRLCAERHAAIGVSDEDLAGSNVYIWRTTPGGNQALAKPCPGCYDFLSEKNVKRIYYTTDEGYEEIRLSGS